MVLSNDSPSSYLWRIQWRENAFQWLREKRQYNDFDLDICLRKIEKNPVAREAALAAFWGAYLGNEVPPVLSDLQRETIRKLLDYGSLRDLPSESIKDLAFVKLHLAGLLAICLIRPDWPTSESPSVVVILETALEAYSLAEPPPVDIDDPPRFGRQLFAQDLFGFSIILVDGISRVELSLRRAEQGEYEEALSLVSEGAWDLCTTTIEAETGYLPATMQSQQEFLRFTPYLPHSGNEFDIQEAANIFEDAKRHSRHIKNWDNIELYCDVLQYLGYHDLYDDLDDVRNDSGEVFGAEEYWGRAITFAKVQKNIVTSTFPIITQDAIERTMTKERLKRDFLRALWEEMDEKIQELLVDAEIEWVHNRVANMVKEIRQLLELSLPSVFPFLQSMTQQRDKRLILTRMRAELSTNKVVRASIDGLKIDSSDKQWAKDELPDFLQKVIHARNYFEKEQHLSGKGSDKHREMMENAVAIHRELLGIECRGELPRLIRIKKATRSKPEKGTA